MGSKRFFSSLDRQFQCEAETIAPTSLEELQTLKADQHFSIQGSGISYVAASFSKNSAVVNLEHFSKILDFDATQKLITVEAGATLDQIYRFLAPHGLYIPVQPGHPQISVGGCIAINIHGKNQFREGLFDSCVEELTLWHPLHGTLTVSREIRPELFELTCGGLGLTGFILKAKLRLKEIPSSWIRVRNIPVTSLSETFKVLDQIRGESDVLYSWNDLATFGSSMGRGYVISGKYDRSLSQVYPVQTFTKIFPHKRKIGRPGLFRLPTLFSMNRAYHFLNTKIKKEQILSFYEFTFPIINKVFYFDLYGSPGFVERQMMIPEDRKFEHLEKFENLVRELRPEIPLTTVKSFSGRQTLLNYSGTGVSLTIDVVNRKRNQVFHDRLDSLNIQMGVIDSVSKDSRIQGLVVAQEYPHFNEFKRRLNEFDPKRIFVSNVSERLNL